MGGKAKILITILAVLALAVVGFNAISVAGQSAGQLDISGPCDEAEHANDPRCTGRDAVDPSPEDSPSVGTGVDISGPCDEAEHANDPRCTGQPVNPGDLEPGEDISGPCDEAEHVNDPRCTGEQADDDNSGPGSGDDDGDDDDNSGPSGNSGRGGDDDEDNSGHGSDD